MLFHPTDWSEGLTTDWEEAMSLLTEWHREPEDYALVEAFSLWDDFCEQLERLEYE